MPNTRNVDERIVEMRLDNKGFEEGANKTISTLEKLERALHLKSDTKGFDDLSDSVSRFDADPMVSGLEKIKEGFSAMEIVGMRVISNLTDSVYNFATRTIKSFTIDPIMQGMGKFGEKTTAVSTLTAQGYELEKVNQLMEDLNWFTDETSYNFTDMVGNIAKFTATGQDLDESVTAMEGIALWAAVSGQNATKASMAMYQLSQAMGKGALKYDDYKSIQNASMDTQEFRQQAAAAAVELGYLKQTAEGVWETTEKTAKSGQAFDLAGLFSSDALSRTTWFSSEVMMNVFNRYSKAVAAVQKYMDDNDIDTASEAMRQMEEIGQQTAATYGISLDEAFQRLGYDLDEFSLKALKAGQNARTWGDVVDSVKDAVSTGWMTTFEHLFGDAETATKFWTDIAEKFYDIFAEGGNTRNSILKLAFGKGSANLDKTTSSVKNMAGGWERLEKRLDESGKTMEDFHKALISVSDEAELETIRSFNGIDDALKNGGISAELFQKAMEKLLGVTDEAMNDTDQNVQHATHSLQEMREVAAGILRGDYGNGEERRKAIEEMGYDFELMQAMAGQLKWGGLGMSDERLIEWMEMYYRYNNLGSRLGANSFAEYLSATAEAADEAAESIENFDDLYEAVVHGIEEVNEVSGEVMTGGDYFRKGILNIIDTFMDIQGAFREGFTNVFGKPKDIAVGLFKLVKGFYQFTNALRLGEGTTAGLTTVFTFLLSLLKGAGTVFGFLAKVAGYAFRGLLSIADILGSIIGKIGETKTLENFGKAFTTVFEALEVPLRQIAGHMAWIFKQVRENVLPGFLEKFGTTLEKISAKVLELAQRFKTFMSSEEVADKISTAFGYLVYYLKALRDGFQGFDLGGELEKIWTWINNIFTGVKAEDSDVLLALEDLGDAASTVTRAITGDPEEVKSRIGTFFQTIKDSIKEELKKITFGDVVNAMKVTALTVFLAKLAGLVEQAKNLTKSITSIPEAIAGTITKAGDVLVAFRKSVMADAYIKIAGAIGILAASLWVLSKIPRDDLTHAATVIALLMLVLSGVVKAMGGFGSRIGDKNYNIGNKLKISVFNGLAAKLIGFAAILGTVVAALAVVRKMNPTTIVTTLLGIAVIIGAVAHVIKFLSDLPDFNSKGIALTLVSLAFALQMLMLPMAELALFTLDPSGNAYMGALFGVAGLLAALTTVIWLFTKFDKAGKTENIMKMAGAMSLISLAVGLMVLPLAALAGIPATVIGKAYATLLGIGLIFTGMAWMFSKIGNNFGSMAITKIAGSMLLIALAMNLMIPVMAAFAGAITVLEEKYTWKSIKENLTPLGELAIILIGFAVAALLFGTALNRVGGGLLKVSASFFLVSVGLLAFAFALEKVSTAFPMFINGLIEAGAGILGNEKKFVWGAVAFTVFAASIGSLVKSIASLFKLGNVGSKFGAITQSIATSAGGMLKTLGKKLIDNMPSLLQLLGAIVVLVGLYFLDIIPQMTEIAVNAFVIFFQSLANSIQKNRKQFVDSVTAIVTTLVGVVKDVFDNLWGQMSFGEKFLLIMGVLIFAATKVSTMMIGTNGKGGLVGTFNTLTGGVSKAIEGMAAGSMFTLSSLAWWLVGIAGMIGGVMWSLDNQQKQFKGEMSAGLGNSPEDYFEKIRRGQEAVNKAQENYNNLVLYGGDLTMADQELTARQIALNDMYKEFAATLGVTTEELKAQIEAADGDITKVEAIQKKLAETAQAAEATKEGVDAITKEGAWDNFRAAGEAFFKSEMPDAAAEGGDASARSFGQMFADMMMGEEGQSIFTGSGEFAADTSMNGIISEVQKYMPGVSDDTVNGFLVQIYNRSGDLFGGGEFMADTVMSGYRSKSRTNSPSKEMQTLGGYAVDGLVLGILNQASDLDTAGGTLADNLIGAISNSMAQVAAVADDQFQISPTITPVVESSGFREYERWSTLSDIQSDMQQTQIDRLVTASREQAESIHSIWDEYALKADEVGGTIEYSLENSRMSGLVSDISAKVDDLGNQIANMQVVLDSGLLVGGIAGNMDRQLGTMSMRRGRGN